MSSHEHPRVPLPPNLNSTHSLDGLGPTDSAWSIDLDGEYVPIEPARLRVVVVHRMQDKESASLAEW